MAASQSRHDVSKLAVPMNRPDGWKPTRATRTRWPTSRPTGSALGTHTHTETETETDQRGGMVGEWWAWVTDAGEAFQGSFFGRFGTIGPPRRSLSRSLSLSLSLSFSLVLSLFLRFEVPQADTAVGSGGHDVGGGPRQRPARLGVERGRAQAVLGGCASPPTRITRARGTVRGPGVGVRG